METMYSATRKGAGEIAKGRLEREDGALLGLRSLGQKPASSWSSTPTGNALPKVLEILPRGETFIITRPLMLLRKPKAERTFLQVFLPSSFGIDSSRMVATSLEVLPLSLSYRCHIRQSFWPRHHGAHRTCSTQGWYAPQILRYVSLP